MEASRPVDEPPLPDEPALPDEPPLPDETPLVGPPTVEEVPLAVVDVATDSDVADVSDMAGGPNVVPGAPDRLLLRGTILTPAGPVDGELLVVGNSIACVAAFCTTGSSVV